MSPRPRNAQSLESRCTRGTQSYRCRVCNGIHPLKKCRRFLRLSAEERLRAALANRYCSSCLAHEHSDGSCRRGDGCKTCGQDHHTLLHPVTKEHRSPPAGDSTRGVSLSRRPSSANSRRGSGVSRPAFAIFRHSQTDPRPPTSRHSSITPRHSFATGRQPSRAVLLGTAIINVCHLGCSFQARALIDSGSKATFITERLFNFVKPPFKTIQAQVSGRNQTISAQSTKLCHFSIRSPSRLGLQLETAAYVLPQLAGNLPSYPIPRGRLKGLPDISLADPNFFESSQVNVLIGADILPSILLGDAKANICGSLLGQKTIFGWVMTGPLSPANPPTA
ncbi:hypothetical protein KR074_010047 [Drosophila pseudoananassae]|nr:hypothetical protein KR074_010047 [Drosophila pseudoananassae]